VAADRPARGLRAGLDGSRFDLRSSSATRDDAPRAYFKGLNLLLNEQQDKAIDAFIEAVQNDPDTTELHFALGNLFRRRGEFERAVRVHQHLLQRADLKAADRDRAQHALAQDFMKAGLFDRAEAAWRAGRHPFDAEAQLALLSLYERSRDWAAPPKWRAARSRRRLVRRAHCPLRMRDRRGGRRPGPAGDAEAALQRAAQPRRGAARPGVLAGSAAARQGDAAAAHGRLGRLRASATRALSCWWPADYAAAHRPAARRPPRRRCWAGLGQPARGGTAAGAGRSGPRAAPESACRACWRT
jgi:lipopolysaccharide biosynthesis regulator YciM